MRLGESLRFGGWRIQRKIVIPFTALVIVVMGVSAIAILLLFNRYTAREIDRKLRDQLVTMNKTGFINPQNQTDLLKVKRTFDVDVIGSARTGLIMGTTLDRSQWSADDISRLEKLLRDAVRTPDRARTFHVRGRSYRMVHQPIPPERNVVLITFLFDLSEVQEARRRMGLAVAGLTVAGILLVALVGDRIARTITQPLRQLVAMTRRIADGDLSRRIDIAREDEIGELAAAFNEMTDQLRRSREELVQAERLATAGQMAATFAHEIRNPLSSIKMMLQLAEERATDDKSARYLANSLEEIDRLDHIVQEMLDFSRPATLQREPCDVVRLLEEVVELMGPNLAHHRIDVTLTSRARPILDADPEALKRVFLNLMLNAVQAQPDGGEIEIETVMTPTLVQIAFSDRGPGFSEEAMQALFRPFFTTKTRGSGLGLATTKRIVEQHGGEILIDNRPDGGARVRLRFPTTRRNEEESA